MRLDVAAAEQSNVGCALASAEVGRRLGKGPQIDVRLNGLISHRETLNFSSPQNGLGDAISGLAVGVFNRGRPLDYPIIVDVGSHPRLVGHQIARDSEPVG